MFDISKTKAILWDLDDTLYSRKDAARAVFFGMFGELLYPDASKEYVASAVDYMMSRVRRNTMVHEDAFAELLLEYPIKKTFDYSACLEYYYDHISEFAVAYKEPVEVIKKVRSLGLKTAIVTNTNPSRVASQKKKIEALGIGGLFDAVVISGEFGIRKPEREIFDHAAALLGVKNEECVFVGDDPESDIRGALNAGMEAVWVDVWQSAEDFSHEPSVHKVASVFDYFGL